jgi:formylglycine-generating enzyme required for sulfatase activity
VAVEQFQRFLKAHPEVRRRQPIQPGQQAAEPARGVTWYEAAQYCRWLSEQEGVPEHEMVYPSVADIEKAKIAFGLGLPTDHLKRRGYRHATEAEWEYACRAGALTSRSYGSSLDLLPRYGWVVGNARDRTWPVGQKKPNDLGLFDMHGNVLTWCHTEVQPSVAYLPAPYARPALDDGFVREKGGWLGVLRVSRLTRQGLRGGAFNRAPSTVRAAHRDSEVPSANALSFGLRVARTCD